MHQETSYLPLQLRKNIFNTQYFTVQSKKQTHKEISTVN